MCAHYLTTTTKTNCTCSQGAPPIQHRHSIVRLGLQMKVKSVKEHLDILSSGVVEALKYDVNLESSKEKTNFLDASPLKTLAPHRLRYHQTI
ncbi:craniofacial development protein 2 [Biomphalaria glabrata]|nr:Biomphalaria glabrata craniofacial development protein 2-like [Biomphalaria glabrata]